MRGIEYYKAFLKRFGKIRIFKQFCKSVYNLLTVFSFLVSDIGLFFPHIYLLLSLGSCRLFKPYIRLKKYVLRIINF